MAVKCSVVCIVAQVDGLELFDESTFGAEKVVDFVEVLTCSLQSDLFGKEVSELVKIIFRDEGHKGMEFCLCWYCPDYRVILGNILLEYT